MKKLLAMAASVLAVASVLVGLQVSGPTASQEPASALSGSSFQAGNIISDANFYNGTAMSADQVQTFLNSQVSSCTNANCLRNGRFSMNSRGADPMCSAVTGGSSLSTAQIITRVSKACGISPRVLLVTLQKEQSLVTNRGPSAAVLERAMGYACPDNVGGRCDPAYAGVGNQMYWSAWQWKRYSNPPGTSNYFTWFNPGATRNIQYNVPTSCGTKAVNVQNKATAALYYYTPYTPNTAALNNLYGTGDSCSAYGNRNFWRMYNDWFGSPTGAAQVVSTAKGSFDGVTTDYNEMTVRGWALDTTTSATTKVVVAYAGRSNTVSASRSRPDVGAAYPKAGAKHGFEATLPARSGSGSVCITAKSADGKTSTSLGCKNVTVPDGSPFGSLDSARAVPGGVEVRGWAIDPETKASIGVRVRADGVQVQRLTANVSRPDVGAAHPGSGAAHGFSAVVPVPAGTKRICVDGVNIGAGASKAVGSCIRTTVPGSTPSGALERVATTSSTIRVTGWAIDGDVTGSTKVVVRIDGKARTFTANLSRSDVQSTYPAYSSKRGFDRTWTVAAGQHKVCVTAVNTGAGANASLGCRTVSVVNSAPVGSLDSVSAAGGRVTVTGWVYDPDTATEPLTVRVSVGGKVYSTTASVKRADVGKAHPDAGPAHGFSRSVGAAAGAQRVCVSALDSEGGAKKSFGCRTVTVR
ncbi:hypothetical protein DEJ23_04315 [Curtobacterium sp. MCSS17_008]|uniref:hypothetical protein n=1 Tax=Curtobacterium sp. MCSS17_008 TaxID=2175647 RepID=UPI000DA8C9D8|nr:hypothetical protein [Curtobacterium sp. MCSS17_008]PZF58998.1 hypothetical protein DEJ23_04315 [Curtobacterium sp. MCSS17_008]